jgi:UDP:flavonoid glycosyltransferase YjiC (YdhE family)
MKFALAAHGLRGDVEPCAAVGLELLRRGHEVVMAVPPNLVGFVESAGLSAVAYGPQWQLQPDEDFARNFWKIQHPMKWMHAAREAIEFTTRGWAQMSSTLTSLAEGADLLVAGAPFQEVAANVGEYYEIPLAALHYFPMCVNGQLIPGLPSPLIRSAMTVAWWVYWRMTKQAEDRQRRELGLPKATCPSPRRIAERGSLEIQAYDEFCFPGLAAEWADQARRRPFTGALTMELPTDNDNEVASWIAAGTPPIYFGFGSMPLESPASTVELISAACAQLGERALICAGGSDFRHIPHFDHVKVADDINHAAIFPMCRAVVHKGGAGTTAAGMRAGIPTLILWMGADQPIWAAQVKRLKVGSARSFSSTTRESLAADLRAILAPRYVTRAREVATHMIKPTASVSTTADLLEERVRP